MVYVDCVRIAQTGKVAAQADAMEYYNVILLDYCVCSFLSMYTVLCNVVGVSAYCLLA